jgi:hypothetical protein
VSEFTHILAQVDQGDPKSLGAAAKKLDTDLASLWWLAYKEAKSTLNEPPAVKP